MSFVGGPRPDRAPNNAGARMIVALLASAACTAAQPAPEFDLADMESWTEATGIDPLAPHRPADTPDCLTGGWLYEGLTLEVDTGECPYAALSQSLLGSFEQGEPIEVVFWHADLVALEPSEGHIAILVDDEMLWERTIPIPSEPCAYTDVIEAPFAAAEGATLRLHLHNHGANTWNLRRVQRAALDTAPSWAAGCTDDR